MKKKFWFLIIVVILIAGWGIYSLNKPKQIEKSGKEVMSKILPKETVVRLDKNGFNPKEISIHPGDAVRWKNNSGAEQTVNSDDYPSNQLYKELNFGVFSDGSSFVHIFKKTGTYTYHNQYLPKQQGKIIVK